jgi:hypothetical protein
VSSAENTHRSHSQLTKQPQRSIYLAGKIQLADQIFFLVVEGAISSKKCPKKAAPPTP